MIKKYNIHWNVHITKSRGGHKKIHIIEIFVKRKIVLNKGSSLHESLIVWLKFHCINLLKKKSLIYFNKVNNIKNYNLFRYKTAHTLGCQISKSIIRNKQNYFDEGEGWTFCRWLHTNVPIVQIFYSLVSFIQFILSKNTF